MDERQIPNPRPLRTPKWLLEIDENIIANLEGKRSTRTIWLWATQLFDQNFSNKTLTEKFQLFVQLLKMIKMRSFLNKLKIRMNKKMERNSIIAKNLFDALNSIGKNTKERDKRAA